jgi:hypothetical protein
MGVCAMVFDLILSWLVIVIPVVLGLVVIAVPAKREDEKSHMRWRYILGTSLMGFAFIAWVQQQRVIANSVKDRESAIADTSKKVSAAVSESVTKSVSRQYEQTISNLNDKITQLKTELQSQGKKVDVIGSSNIVTGKHPVKVEVTNTTPTPTPSTVPKIEGIEIVSTEPLQTSPYKDAPYGVKVILQTKTELQPVKFGIECDKEVSYGELSTGVNFTGVVGISTRRLTNLLDNSIKKNSWAWQISEPKFVPESPWIVRLYGKEPLHVVGGQMFH